jgi:putative two-component system response regulator
MWFTLKIVFAVDDNETNLTAVKLALDGTYKTYAFRSAAKMFKLLGKITPDLILLDVQMPETDGFQTMRLLKSDDRFKGIGVVFLTVTNDPDVQRRALELGVLDFIEKPFSPPALIECIEKYTER